MKAEMFNNRINFIQKGKYIHSTSSTWFFIC